MTINVDASLCSSERDVIEAFLRLVGTDTPSLEDIWACMDFAWDLLGCDNRRVDPPRLERFYRHPVWLLNALFIEQDTQSLANREVFATWIANKKLDRIADIGGGFGKLARVVAEKSPNVTVEIIEPWSHTYGRRLLSTYPRLSYVSGLTGMYDLLVATDVFEHVVDPLGLVESSAAHLKEGGFYLTANSFHPVVKCHLPVTFHFRKSWEGLLRKMNLEPIERVAYGVAFQKRGPVSARSVRWRERVSQFRFLVANIVRRRFYEL